jgi:phosphate transport system ATP-binding protein
MDATVATREKLQVRNVSFRYGSHLAVEEVSFPVFANRVTALIGPSGCGKSTLLRIFNRMYELYPDQRAEGEILLDGVDLIGPGIASAELRTRIGMVFQAPAPFPMSIYDNVAYGVRLYRRCSRPELDRTVEAALRRAALWDEVKDRLRQNGQGLSGGQQQRLCIARAVAAGPEVLLLDEPCSAMDPGASAKIEETIVELRSELTIVIVTHNIQQAGRISDFIGFMYLGKLLEFGTTEKILTAPEKEETDRFVSGRFG